MEAAAPAVLEFAGHRAAWSTCSSETRSFVFAVCSGVHLDPIWAGVEEHVVLAARKRRSPDFEWPADVAWVAAPGIVPTDKNVGCR